MLIILLFTFNILIQDDMLVAHSASYGIPIDASKPETYSALMLRDLIFLADSVTHLNNKNNFTNQLKEEIKKLFEVDRETYRSANKQLLMEALNNINAEGKAAVCLATLNDFNTLRISHVGNVGFHLFRKENEHEHDSDYKVLGRSFMKEKSLNESYFVGKDGDGMDKDEIFFHTLHNEDILIIHNHGVENNLFSKKMGLEIKRLS